MNKVVKKPETGDEVEASSAPLIEHLIELRKRVMWSLGGFFVAFIVCFAYAQPLYNLLILPFRWGVEWAGFDTDAVQFIYTAPQEFFFTQVKVAVFGGAVIAFPIIATQVYRFVAPGLYKSERAAFLPFLVAAPLLFLLGAALVYFFFTPMVMWFFLAMQQTGVDGEAKIQLLPRVSEYLSLIMTLVFAFGLVFQLPIVTTLLARAGLATAEGLADKRKYAIVGAFVVAAVLTPPDPVSQIGLAVPTIILYEIGIYCAKLVERGRAKRQAEHEAEEARLAAEASSTPAA
jgi:sec-independent protein translocase protein TatC